MKYPHTHKKIKRMFRCMDSDNLPYTTRRGSGRNLLPYVFNRIGYKVGVEIGVKQGRYSKVICDGIPDIHLYCVDPWKPYSEFDDGRVPDRNTVERYNSLYEDAQKTLKDYNVTFIRKSSAEAIFDFEDGSLDFVYIDGNHNFDYVMEDIIQWSRKVRGGGVVACHDYHVGGWYGVVKAVDAYTHAHHIDPWYATKETVPTAFWVNP